jgi:2-oxo-4-hydroxy-4-carboxy-5-ureidoimidazoline decarboxylase
MTIEDINAMPRAEFTKTFGGLFEHSPWIAEQTIGPFEDINDLFVRLTNTVSEATDEQKLALIRAHPDLVGKLAKEGKLTRESTAEQKAAGLTSLSPDEVQKFEKYNAEYRAKFGFPFVICARENKKSAILKAFPERLQNSVPQEMNTALSEIYKIARLRLIDLFAKGPQ